MVKLVRGFDAILEKGSRFGLIACLVGFLGLTVFSIVLRWSGTAILWLEPLSRHLVFLSAFLGGSLATSANVHIKVDVLTKLIEKSSSKIIKWMHHHVMNLFCFIVTLVLTKSAWDFFLVEKEFGAPGFLDIHSAYLVFIIPFGMGLICLRYLNQFILHLSEGKTS